MKQLNSSLSRSLKALSLLSAATLLILIMFSFNTARRAGDLWQQLGITRERGDESIQAGFLHGYFSYYNAASVHSIATGNKLAIAQDLLKYTKEYVVSNEFKNMYDRQRAASKPNAPEK